MKLAPWPHGWRHHYEYTHSTNRDYSFEVATDQIHPRCNCASHRFEVRTDDISQADTEVARRNNDGIARERSEMAQHVADQQEGELKWYGWSFFVPTSFPESAHRGDEAWPYISLTQFMQRPGTDGRFLPALVFAKWIHGDFQLRQFPHLRGASRSWSLIPGANFRGQWHDIVLKVLWTEKPEGVLDVWVNDVHKVHEENLSTRTSDTGGIYHKYGLYRIADPANQPAVAYFSQLRMGSTRAEVTLS